MEGSFLRIPRGFNNYNDSGFGDLSISKDFGKLWEEKGEK